MHDRVKHDRVKSYWNKNIEYWGEKYLDISHGHEVFDRPAWFTTIYNETLGRLERRLMKERYRRTIAFLDKYLKPGTVFTDLGCGTGIFVVEAAKRGAVVNAVDFSESSLNATRKAVAIFAPRAVVNFIQADVQAVELPISDVTLAMGVTPYLTDIAGFIANAIPQTGILCIQYTDSAHWANRIRRKFPILDVRSLQCYDRNLISALYAKHGGIPYSRDGFASGYIDVVANIERVVTNLDTHRPMTGGRERTEAEIFGLVRRRREAATG